MKKIIRRIHRVFVEIEYSILKYIGTKFHIANAEETVDYVIKNEMSVSRYGDGELDMIFKMLTKGKYLLSDSFQVYDENLAHRLYDILKEGCSGKHIVCIPYWFKEGVNQYKPDTRYFCKRYFCKNIKLILNCINLNKKYYNANFTRFYNSFIDKSDCQAKVAAIKKIWNNKDICIVEGEYSRLGVGNDLFSNATSIIRILCPAQNAYVHYNSILNTVRQKVSRNRLILIALGHTATVLAYDLCANNYQALDIGHIDIEYEWMLMQAKEKVPVKNKYVNEVGNKTSCSPCLDPVYTSQIIARIV